MSDAVTVEIDGVELEAPKGTMLIEVADRAGIRIPRFCYHKKLSVAANCRMCLVEVEKAPKPLPACATPVMDGMKVSTTSAYAVQAQRSVMEFLLINHPLDCPICDQGGECELQDVAMGYGRGVSRFNERKRVVADPDLGPLIATDMTRCIHCTRCVRFGVEIAGLPELGATGRGEFMEIGTFVEKSVDSEMSGNVIDLCPVGALTSKPFRYRARPWELRERPSVAAHDAIGSNLAVHVLGSRVMRIVPRENEAVNEVWLSDRDRFSYEGLYADDRLSAPRIKVDGEWREVDWEVAVNRAVDGLRGVADAAGPGEIGVLGSPSATVEELFLLQKLARAMGCPNVDHRLSQTDFGDDDELPSHPHLGQSLGDLEQVSAALLVGSNPRKDQPLANHRLRKAAGRGAAIMSVNGFRLPFNFDGGDQIVAGPAAMVAELAAVAAALPAGVDDGLGDLLSGVGVEDRHRNIAGRLEEADRSTVLLGPAAAAHPHAAALRALAAAVARRSGSTLGYLSPGANGAGAALAGMLPHRGPAGAPAGERGLAAGAMLERGRRGFLLLGLEPELDAADAGAARAAMARAEFVVSLTPFATPEMAEYADVLLPIAPSFESAGTFVNAAGEWQTFEPVVKPHGDARPAWRVLRVMGSLVDARGFEYMTAEEVRNEVRSLSEEVEPDNAAGWRAPAALPAAAGDLVRIGDVPMYAVDMLVRRAPSLQRTADAAPAAVRLNRRTAEGLGLGAGDEATVAQGDHTCRLPVVIDDDVADGCARVVSGLPETSHLGPAYGPLSVTPA